MPPANPTVVDRRILTFHLVGGVTDERQDELRNHVAGDHFLPEGVSLQADKKSEYTVLVKYPLKRATRVRNSQPQPQCH